MGQSHGDERECKAHILENPPQKRIKETETGSDWISKLPDALITQILSLLPTTDACKTTILSKRWLNLWTCIDSLNFYTEYLRCGSLELDNFISFTDNVLSHLTCSNIKNFNLCFYIGYGHREPYYTKIDEWLEVAVKKNVEDLYLDLPDVDGEPYCLQQVLCSSSSIQSLSIVNCGISEDCVLNWTSLKSLWLEHLYLRDEHIEQIVSNCPQLESLQLRSFCAHRLHITSQKLRRLELIQHVHPHGDCCPCEEVCLSIIFAPYVQHLNISGDCDGMRFRFEDLSSLLCACLTFRSYIYVSCFNIIDKTTIVNDLLLSVRWANELKVSSWLIEVISMLVLKKEDISLPLLECKQLTIKPWLAKYSFPGIDSLLRSTPHLENLTIRPVKFRYIPIDDWDTSNDSLRDNFLSLQGNIFKGSMLNLKSIKASTSILYSCLFRVDEAELHELLKSLLEHAPNLEKLVIAPRHIGCDICRNTVSKMIESLLAFPRASNSAVISLG